MKSTVLITLSIDDFEDITHTEVSERLQLQPTKEFVKGAPRGGAYKQELVYTRNRWLYDVTNDERHSFEEQMDILTSLINARSEEFKTLTTRYNCSILIGVYCYHNESTPSITIEKRHVQALREYNFVVDVDIILLSDTPDNADNLQYNR